jgi:hypothetical protein
MIGSNSLRHRWLKYIEGRLEPLSLRQARIERQTFISLARFGSNGREGILVVATIILITIILIGTVDGYPQ